MEQEKVDISENDKKLVKACIDKLDRSLREKIRREIRICFRDTGIMRRLSDTQEEVMTLNFKKLFALVEKKMNKMVTTFEKIQASSETAEETFCNVLLAIQQNEYLHAWYPEQGGYPEMKVVGQHPLRTERKKFKKKKG